MWGLAHASASTKESKEALDNRNHYLAHLRGYRDAPESWPLMLASWRYEWLSYSLDVNNTNTEVFAQHSDGGVELLQSGRVDVRIQVKGSGAHLYRYVVAALNRDILPNNGDGAGDPSGWHYANCKCAHGTTVISFTASVEKGDVLRVATVPAHSNFGIDPVESFIDVHWVDNTW